MYVYVKKCVSVCALDVRMSFSCAGAYGARLLSSRGQRSRLPLPHSRLSSDTRVVGRGGGGLAEKTNTADAHNVNTHSHTLRSAVLLSTVQCCKYVCKYVSMLVCMHVSTYVRMRECVNVYACMYVCM